MENAVPEPAQTAQVASEQEDQSPMLAALGQALLKASGKKSEQAEALKALREILPKLNPKEFPELLEDPIVEAFLEQIGEERADASDLPPGSVIDRGKPTERIKDWTEQDLQKSGMPVVTFTPIETMPVIWNGLRCQLIAGEEITTFKCFKDAYDEHIFETRFAEAHKQWLMGQRTNLPHPDMANPDGIRARAAGTKGTYEAAAGLFEVGTAEIPSGQQEGASGEAA